MGKWRKGESPNRQPVKEEPQTITRDGYKLLGGGQSDGPNSGIDGPRGPDESDIALIVDTITIETGGATDNQPFQRKTGTPTGQERMPPSVCVCVCVVSK